MENAKRQSFKIIEHIVIPLRDGCKLAARVWMPENADETAVPAILEYLPYRKRDGTAIRDEINHGHFASKGYACLRVDIRGSGESEGLLDDEYTPQELADGKEIIEWIADQPWCSGNVGIIGISWGGFNGLQIAALEPKPLKAVVTVCSTDDRYADDIHFKGGCLLNDNMTWSQQMLAYSSRPPDPELVGDNWREMWFERLQHLPLLASKWLRHQRRDDYWAHGSVCEDYSGIKAAVLAVGGWADAYSNAIPRLLSGLSAPCKTIIGPWEHEYPNLARIEPRIDFLNHVTLWWDQWLKGIKSGAIGEPNVHAYVLQSKRPSSRYAPRDGNWISADRWPPADVTPLRLFLAPDGLQERPGKETTVSVNTPQHHGSFCGAFCPGMRIDEELPGDQSLDDLLCPVFDSAPLPEAIEIVGAPVFEFDFSTGQPVCQLIVRLCELGSDGDSALITWAPLNLNHIESHADPSVLQPGEQYRARIQLNDIAYAIPAGHRLRLAVATTYWPMLWPSPQAGTVDLHLKHSHINLPVRRAQKTEGKPLYSEPDNAEPLRETLIPESRRSFVGKLHPDGSVVSETEDDFGMILNPETGLTTGSRVHQRFSIKPEDPLSAEAEASWTQILERSAWRVRTETSTKMTCDSGYFYLDAELEAYEQEDLVYERRWSDKIPRDHP
jgi:putative CocE/NonD family hydrolase